MSREIRFDTENVLVAVSVMGQTRAECRAQWAAAVLAGADVVEWRLDYLGEELDHAGIAALAKQMRTEHGLPILATYRTVADGGKADFARPSEYREALTAAATWADLVDVEVSVPGSSQIIRDLGSSIPVVASFHDFTSGPSTGITKQLLEHMVDLGAAVGKVAWMVAGADDLALVQTLQQWAADSIGIPTVVIGMGAQGTASRLGESARLSAFTFARGVGASAPGQPTAEEIRASIAD